MQTGRTFRQHASADVPPLQPGWSEEVIDQRVLPLSVVGAFGRCGRGSDD